jgi:hypothetical protein
MLKVNKSSFRTLESRFLNILRTTLVISALFCISSCDKQIIPGYLIINAQDDSAPVEIFKIADDSEAFSLSGEVVGVPNVPLELKPGTYLVMADCSHELIVVRPNEQVELNITKLKFTVPNVEFDPNDFSVQCDRFKASIFRQQLTGTFELDILEGKRNILVNMSPLSVNQLPIHRNTPNVIILSGLRIGQPESNKVIKQKYFVSLMDETISITKPVKLGKWFIGLKGKYEISINGSKKVTSLAVGETKELKLGRLKVSPPPSVDMSIISKIRGYPYVIKVNGTHELLPNEIYYLLPGVLDISLDQSSQKTSVEIYEQELTKIPLKSVQIALDCAPWEWECLGKGEVMLYRGDDNYPFMESITDIPVLYMGSDIKVGIAGSREIKVDIPDRKTDVSLATGTLILEPEIISSKSYITDLIRLGLFRENIN